MKTTRSIEQARSELLRGSLPAMARAALRAREVARATHTALVMQIDGRIEHVRFSDSNEIARPASPDPIADVSAT